MKCLCDGEMVDTTDMDSGDMREFVCPKCHSRMHMHKDTIAAYLSKVQPRDYVSDAIRALVYEEVRKYMPEEPS